MPRAVPVSIAVVANAPAPYRVHVHERIAEEIPSVRLTSIFLADGNIQDWSFGDLSHIGAVSVGPGEALGQRRGVVHSLRKAWRTVRELRRCGARAVVVGGYSHIEGLAAMAWAKAHGVRVLLAADSNWAGDTASGPKRWLKTALVRGVVRVCDALLPCGVLGRRYYASYGADEARMFDMPYEADVRPIREMSAQRVAEVRAKHGLDVDRRRIVCSGRHVHIKGWDVAIEAFNAIAGDRPEWDLVLAGDGELRRKLESKVAPHLRDRVVWLGFLEDQEELMALYRCSDILLHPARREPWGVVIQEAVAAGMAVVASDVTGAAADLVEHGVNGFVVAVDDVPGTTVALGEATHPDRIAELKVGSAEVYERWASRCDPVAGLMRALHAVGVLGTSGEDEVQGLVLRPAAA